MLSRFFKAKRNAAEEETNLHLLSHRSLNEIIIEMIISLQLTEKTEFSKMERMSTEKEKRVQIVSVINSKRLLDIYFFLHEMGHKIRRMCNIMFTFFI